MRVWLVHLHTHKIKHRQALLGVTCHLLLALRHLAAAQDPPERLVQSQEEAGPWLTDWLCSHPEQQQAGQPI